MLQARAQQDAPVDARELTRRLKTVARQAKKAKADAGEHDGLHRRRSFLTWTHEQSKENVPPDQTPSRDSQRKTKRKTWILDAAPLLDENTTPLAEDAAAATAMSAIKKRASMPFVPTHADLSFQKTTAQKSAILEIDLQDMASPDDGQNERKTEVYLPKHAASGFERTADPHRKAASHQDVAAPGENGQRRRKGGRKRVGERHRAQEASAAQSKDKRASNQQNTILDTVTFTPKDDRQTLAHSDRPREATQSRNKRHHRPRSAGFARKNENYPRNVSPSKGHAKHVKQRQSASRLASHVSGKSPCDDKDTGIKEKVILSAGQLEVENSQARRRRRSSRAKGKEGHYQGRLGSASTSKCEDSISYETASAAMRRTPATAFLATTSPSPRRRGSNANAQLDQSPQPWTAVRKASIDEAIDSAQESSSPPQVDLGRPRQPEDRPDWTQRDQSKRRTHFPWFRSKSTTPSAPVTPSDSPLKPRTRPDAVTGTMSADSKKQPRPRENTILEEPARAEDGFYGLEGLMGQLACNGSCHDLGSTLLRDSRPDQAQQEYAVFSDILKGVEQDELKETDGKRAGAVRAFFRRATRR